MLRVTGNPFIFHTFQEKSCGLHTRLAVVNHRCPFPYFCLRGGRLAHGGVCTQANTSPVCGVLLWKKTHSQQTEAKTKKKRPTLFRVAHAEMPTSRGLKSGDSLFFTSPLPRKFRTLHQVLHEVDTIQIRGHRFDARNNFCQ